MKPSLSLDDVRRAIPEPTAELLTKVLRGAVKRDDRIHLVGGPVRDLLLGRALADVDLMVEGDARALADAVAKSDGGITVVGHDRFGTVRLESDAAQLDLAALRHESYAHAGALPDVEAGTLAQDMQRRDFSINALTCPLDARDPERRFAIEDLEGGVDDLAKKRLRVLHPASFHDDPTRAWRAARFAARLGFSLDRASRNALRNALRDGAFGAVSGERFRRELQLSFDEAHYGVHVGRIFRLLSDWHVLAALEPGLVFDKDCASPLRRLSRTIADPEWSTPKWRPWAAGLSIWLCRLPAAQRRRVLERFSVRGEQAKRIVEFGRDRDRMLKGLARARGRGAVDALLGDLPEETTQALYAMADVPVRRRILRWGAEDRRRRAPVGGAELVELGLEGTAVGKTLKRIRAGFLDGEIANREEALALAEEIARREGRRKAPGAAKAKPRKVARRSTIADTPAKRSGRRPKRSRSSDGPEIESAIESTNETNTSPKDGTVARGNPEETESSSRTSEPGRPAASRDVKKKRRNPPS